MGTHRGPLYKFKSVLSHYNLEYTLSDCFIFLRSASKNLENYVENQMIVQEEIF